MKYPEIEVQLTGTDGNAFALLGKVSQALRKGKVSKESRDEFMKEAMSGNYNHLLATCAEWCNVY